MTRQGRRGYRVDEVDALLHQLAYELHRRTRERDEMRAQNQRKRMPCGAGSRPRRHGRLNR
ncbi:DivIVA domain-containing protein [Micromonospora sp. NPDC007230]|uniref:DivIVA domain-containing protein n=1 Tax=Micromonospora sp. NPDC007230 TaxID=3364237 RepID=UPI0036C3CD58